MSENGRHRSRSPPAERRRSRDRSRDRDRDRDRELDRDRDRERDRDKDRERNRSRDRDRSPDRNRDKDRDKTKRERSNSREREKKKSRRDAVPFGERSKKAEDKKADEKTVVLTEGMSEDDMMKAMGFPVGFDTTKGKEKPADVKHHAVRLKTKRVYRQYMNKRGGLGRAAASNAAPAT